MDSNIRPHSAVPTMPQPPGSSGNCNQNVPVTHVSGPALVRGSLQGKLQQQGDDSHPRWGVKFGSSDPVPLEASSTNRLQELTIPKPTNIRDGMPVTVTISVPPYDPRALQRATAAVHGEDLALDIHPFEAQTFMQDYGHSFINFIMAHMPRGSFPSFRNALQDNTATSESSRGSVPALCRFPTEVLLPIAKSLPLADKQSLRQVNRDFDRITTSTVDRIRIGGPNDLMALHTFPYADKVTLAGGLITDVLLKDIIELHPGITEIELSSCDAITDNGLDHLIKNLPNLTHLKLTRCPEITDAGFRSLESAQENKFLTRLTHLDVGNTPMFSAGTVKHLDQLPNLTHLNLHSCDSIATEALAHIGKLKGLTSLGLMNCPSVSNASLQHLSNLNQLTNLNLRYCMKIGNAGLSHVSKLGNLTYLDLENCQQITDDGLRHVGQLTRLTHLDLGQCKKITSEGLDHLAPLAGSLSALSLHRCSTLANACVEKLTQFTHLTRLNLGGIHQLDSAALTHFLPYPDPDNPGREIQPFSRLIRLDLEHTHNIESIKDLRCLSSLEQLNLRGCSSLVDLEEVENLSGLKSLNLSGCDGLDAASGWSSRLRNLPLTSLDVSGCHIQTVQWQDLEHVTSLQKLNLGHATLEAGSLRHVGKLTSLTHLDLSNATMANVDLLNLKTLTNLKELKLNATRRPAGDAGRDGMTIFLSLSRLTSLDMANSKHVSHKGLYNLTQLRNLHNLNLKNCLLLMDDVLERYAQQMPQLATLDIYGCENVTDKAVTFLLQMRNLRKLDARDTEITMEGTTRLRKNISIVSGAMH